MTTFQSSYSPETQPVSPRGHYVFVDGPSIDGTLGRVINQQPGPDTRPDWRRLETFVKQVCGPAPYSATFVFWGPGQEGFMHFLRMAGFAVMLGERYTPGQSCADLIQQSIARLNETAVPGQPWQVIVGTHNPTLIEALPSLASEAERISVFGFTEFLPDSPMLETQIDFYDIEDDAKLFRNPLPRVEFEDEDKSEDAYEDAHGNVETPALEEITYQPPPVQPRPVVEPPAPAATPPIVQAPAAPPPVQTPAAPRLTTAPAAPPRPAASAGAVQRDFYLIVDGRSIEKELGEILGEKPTPGTRPDWAKVHVYARQQSRSADGQVKALFAHIAPGHAGFRRALIDLNYEFRPVRPDPQRLMRPVVEEYVCQLLSNVIAPNLDRWDTAPDIMVIGHGDALFVALNAIADRGQRLIALGFPERMPQDEAYERIEKLDLERDARAFGAELPREFGVDVDNFDPDQELARLL